MASTSCDKTMNFLLDHDYLCLDASRFSDCTCDSFNNDSNITCKKLTFIPNEIDTEESGKISKLIIFIIKIISSS